MHAAIFEGVNQPVIYKETATPTPAANDVVLKLKTAALNHRDVWIQKGQYAGLKFPIIPGSDGAGVVHELGAGVDKSWLGKEVVINPSLSWGASETAQQKSYKILGLPDDGTFAEYIKIPAENLALKPAHLTFEQAAAFPLAGLTAYRALFSRANLQRGETVLITGVGGGAAVFALQFAVAHGANVFVTSSSDAKIAKAVALGATGGRNYTAETFAEDLQKESGGFDVIIDSAGGNGFEKLITLANPGARIAFFGATAGDPTTLPMRKIFWKQLSLLGSTMGSPRDFAAMTAFIESHKLVPVVDSVFTLRETETALRKMDAGGQMGKLVLSMR
jgi:zinc-binding alcohol dehydrogenase/oxidoreductase